MGVLDKDSMMMEMSANVKAILVRLDDVKEDVAYLARIKNKHEERISHIENIIPDDLDNRLRDIEKQIIKFALVMGMISTISGILISKLIDLISV